jgi:hypothetical protein
VTRRPRHGGVDKELLIVIIALLVGGVWAITVLVSLLTREYTALTAITPVMLIVCGFLFGVREKVRNGNGKG